MTTSTEIVMNWGNDPAQAMWGERRRTDPGTDGGDAAAVTVGIRLMSSDRG